MGVLDNLVPEKVFYYFEELCNIPHGSKNTKAISDYCVNFANEKVYLPAVLLFAQIRSDYPVSVLKRLFQTLQKVPFFMFPVQIY